MIRHKKSLRLCTDIATNSRGWQTLHTKAADGAKIIEAETQSMFGSVEDLIAMGYSGNLEFERDFLGEGLDMINNF